MGEPGAVGFLKRWIGQMGDRPAQFGPHAPVGGAAEDPAAFLEPLHQPGLAQKLQMPRDTGLALAHDLDQLADCQFSLAQKQQQAQPGGITRGPQHGNQPIHCIQHINISLYAQERVTRKGLDSEGGKTAKAPQIPTGGPGVRQ